MKSRPPARGVRTERCDGCWRSCRRAEVKTSMTYADVKALLKAEVKKGGPAKAVTRATILGRLYAIKEEIWRHQLETCGLRGEALPTDIPGLLAWAKKLHTVTVRVALGLSRAKARQMRRGLKASELAEYYNLLAATPF